MYTKSRWHNVLYGCPLEKEANLQGSVVQEEGATTPSFSKNVTQSNAVGESLERFKCTNRLDSVCNHKTTQG
jgi:hypothetical protein